MRKLFLIENGSELARQTADHMIELLGKGFEVCSDPKDADMVLVFGGDGAFLHGLESCGFPEAPILGINTGHLGFFQELLPEDANRKRLLPSTERRVRCDPVRLPDSRVLTIIS